LYLHVTTGGHKGWRWKYRFGGKERGLVFGSFPEISLKRARDMRDDARALLRQGVDPGDERRRAALRRIAGVDANSTFQVVAERWHTMQAPQWKERHASDVITSLTNEVFPIWAGVRWARSSRSTSERYSTGCRCVVRSRRRIV
jgi:hypothetical protein